MAKKILFPLFSIFLVYRSYDLIKNLLSSTPGDLQIYEMFIVAFLLNLFITGVFAFPGFAYKTSYLLPDSYYRVTSPHNINRVYKVLGVKYFRLGLLLAFWGKEKNRKKYFNGTKKGLKNFIFQTRQSEFGHLGAFVSILICSLILIFQGYFVLFVFINIINIIGNFYPVILQRKHRMRIEKITHRF